MKLNIEETRYIIMNIFIDNTKVNDFYDTDMFISDIKSNIANRFETEADTDAADAMYAFECAVIDVIRNDDVYNWYGPEGCAIIVAELFDFSKKFFDEAD